MKYKSLFLAGLLVCSGAFAADKPADPKKQTSWNLYVDSKEAFEMKQKEGNKVLFVDVRDPIEIMFTGFTDVVDINIPFKTANATNWQVKKKGHYTMKVNKRFESLVEKALTDRGLDKSAPIILMCRSGGSRGAPSSKLLEGKGYKNVYVVTDGFEGGTIKKGDKKNWRLKNGWKNAGLPWGYKLNRAKMYFPANSKEPHIQASIKTMKMFGKTLKGTLKKAAKKDGFANAIQVCSKKAGPIAEDVSAKQGMKITRVSLKNRNPDNAPNDWQTKILKRFEAKKAKGVDVKKLAYSAIVEENGQKQFRFVKAIETGKLCLKCHGSKIDPEITEKLNEFYPDDKATGFSLGDIRGAFVITKDL